ncbi:hypothetical protein GCM10022222_71380 [Amycolatopsis ultiminotia]|uniref:Uncharacterized protein n=1 Tax=Amycolatopsis ultiminotia TaxID=543629 RepID=A0ABP6Y3X1_9PSEU
MAKPRKRQRKPPDPRVEGPDSRCTTRSPDAHKIAKILVEMAGRLNDEPAQDPDSPTEVPGSDPTYPGQTFDTDNPYKHLTWVFRAL